MGNQPESKLSRAIMDALRNRGAFVHKNHGNEYSMAGLPDIEGCWRGTYFAIETKMPGKLDTVTAIQRLRHRQIRDAGGHVLVATNVPEAVAWVTGLPVRPTNPVNASTAN